MTSMINLKASRKTGTINVGVNPITNINVHNPPGTTGSSANGVCPTTTVHYPDPNSVDFQSVNPQILAKDDLEKEALLREINVLKLIIEIQHSNPMIVNKYIVADDDSLGKMVGLLCNATEVHLDADDVGVGCISKKTYRKVNSIYVVVNGETLNLKYDFPSVMKQLKDLHISVKYVY